MPSAVRGVDEQKMPHQVADASAGKRRAQRTRFLPLGTANTIEPPATATRCVQEALAPRGRPRRPPRCRPPRSQRRGTYTNSSRRDSKRYPVGEWRNDALGRSAVPATTQPLPHPRRQQQAPGSEGLIGAASESRARTSSRATGGMGTSTNERLEHALLSHAASEAVGRLAGKCRSVTIQASSLLIAHGSMLWPLLTIQTLIGVSRTCSPGVRTGGGPLDKWAGQNAELAASCEWLLA